MATIDGELWMHNMAKVIVVDVSDDYLLMQPPLPSDLYPVLTETYLPRYGLTNFLPSSSLVSGYLYDWHQSPENDFDVWYVGVVQEQLANDLMASA